MGTTRGPYWGVTEARLLLKRVQVQAKSKSSNNSTRTGGRRTIGSADPVKMRLQPTRTYRTINLYLNFTAALHERGKMATTPTTIPTREAEKLKRQC